MSNEYNGNIVPSGTLKGILNTALGKDGKDAYKLAVEKGFAGTEEEWLESLKWKPDEGVVTPEMLDRDYWQMLARVPVRSYGDLDSIISEKDSFNSIYRVEFTGLSAIKKIIGEGSFVAIVRYDKSGLFLLNIDNGESWIYKAGSNELISPDRERLKSGAEVTLTAEQVYALDKMFELAAYKDEAVAEVYKGFVSAFGLDKYREMRLLDGSELISAGLSNYWNPAEAPEHDWKQAGASLEADGKPLTDGIPYAYQQREDGSSTRTIYPDYDITAEGGYSYQIYFEANEGVKLALEFYNQNVLDAYANSENWSTSDFKDGYGWQDSMGYEWVPPAEINGSPIKAMRLNFNSGNAGVKKVIIYRKKVAS